MEKFSKWRDPSTGIQPFLPIAQPQLAPAIKLLLFPLTTAFGLLESLLLVVITLIHVILVDGACLIFIPVPPLYRLVSKLFTASTCRLALGVMGYYWITTELVSGKKSAKNVSQTNRSPRAGDLIITNYTSQIDILYLAYRYNPTFLLPTFAPLELTTSQSTGRHTGTGSANISSSQAQPDFLGYTPIPLLNLLARTGSLPPTEEVLAAGSYKTLKGARRGEKRVVVLLAEGTTSNGRAVLKFPEGVLEEGDIGRDDEGIVWLKFFRHAPPTPLSAPSTSPLPLTALSTFNHLSQLPIPKSLHIRTLHPSHSPSSPSFLPSEILSNTPGGFEGVGKNGEGAWREGVAVTLAELGRVRRVRGMGWVEKSGFLGYYYKRGRK